MFDSFFQHINRIQQITEQALQATGFSQLLIGSGQPHGHFLDDYSAPFKANPHFVHWLPFLTQNPNCWLLVRPGVKPRLYFYVPDDFWHAVADVPSEDWCEAFDIEAFSKLDQLQSALPSVENLAVISPQAAPIDEDKQTLNPESLINYLHFERSVKTEWEQHCLYLANLIASRAHRLARKMFSQNATEYEIHQAYIKEIEHHEYQMPYGNIVALNENAAVLHYQHHACNKPDHHRTLLIDAGAVYNGYAADITRTVTSAGTIFSDIVGALDIAQLQMVDHIHPGASFIELHQLAHRMIAEILQRFDLATGSIESLIEQGITSTFFPHGLGHYLGIQVHDVGGWQIDHQGTLLQPPEEHPFLRLTRPLEVGNVVTIEPGLYFIPSLLAELRQKPAAKDVNWSLVESLMPWGGIRIEDNVLVTELGHDNLTRRAFDLVDQ